MKQYASGDPVQKNRQPRITRKKRIVYFVCSAAGRKLCVGMRIRVFLFAPAAAGIALVPAGALRACEVRSGAARPQWRSSSRNEDRQERTAAGLDSLRDVSPAMQSAIVAGEDHRFYRHGGVDWISFGGAVFDRIVHSRTRGASTISMQLAAMVTEDLRSAGDAAFDSFKNTDKSGRRARWKNPGQKPKFSKPI